MQQCMLAEHVVVSVVTEGSGGFQQSEHACMLTCMMVTHICMKKEKASSMSSSSMVNSSSDSDSGWVTFW